MGSDMIVYFQVLTTFKFMYCDGDGRLVESHDADGITVRDPCIIMHIVGRDQSHQKSAVRHTAPWRSRIFDNPPIKST